MAEENNGEDAAREPNGETTADAQIHASGNQDIPPATANDNAKADQGETAKLAREIRSGEKWLIEIGIATVLINSVIGLIYWGQLKAMQKSTDASVIAANASKKSADAATSAARTASATLRNQQRSFEIDQRPYMVAVPPPEFVQAPPGNQVQANITVKNIGRTPAMKYLLYIELTRYEAPADDKKKRVVAFLDGKFRSFHERALKGRIKLSLLREEEDIAPSNTQFATTNPIAIDGQQAEKLADGRLVLYYLGLISYSDSFGNQYFTEFCSFYFGANTKLWHACDLHSTIN